MHLQGFNEIYLCLFVVLNQVCAHITHTRTAPPDGVHCGGSDSTRKAHYLRTHFDRFQALIIIF